MVLAVVVHGHQARNEGHRPLLIQRRPQKLDFQDYAAQIEKTFEELEQVCLDSELTRDISDTCSQVILGLPRLWITASAD